MTVSIRLAREADAEQMLAIYTPVVRELAISFELEPLRWTSSGRGSPRRSSVCPGWYVVMSLNRPRIVRVSIEDGSAGGVEKVVDLPATVPDGVAFDTEANRYISCYRPDRIYRLSSGGELEVLAEDREGTIMAAPTNIAFCGAERDILLSANLGRWHITRYDLGAHAIGAPLNYPKLDS